MKASDITKENLPDLRAREKMKGLGEVEILQAWFKSEHKFSLNEREQAMRDRWMFARSEFLTLKSYKEVIEALMAEYDISIAQARIDVRNMNRVFADIDQIGRDAHRSMAIEMARKAFIVAEKEKDAAGMAAASKAYYMAAGLDKEEPDKLDIDKLMRDRTYAEILDPSIRNMMLNFIGKGQGSVDVSEIFEQIITAVGTETIDYETVKDDDTGADTAGN